MFSPILTLCQTWWVRIVTLSLNKVILQVMLNWCGASYQFVKYFFSVADYSYTKKTFISFSRQCTAGPALWRGPAVPASLPCAHPLARSRRCKLTMDNEELQWLLAQLAASVKRIEDNQVQSTERLTKLEEKTSRFTTVPPANEEDSQPNQAQIPDPRGDAIGAAAETPTPPALTDLLHGGHTENLDVWLLQTPRS